MEADSSWFTPLFKTNSHWPPTRSCICFHLCPTYSISPVTSSPRSTQGSSLCIRPVQICWFIALFSLCLVFELVVHGSCYRSLYEDLCSSIKVLASFCVGFVTEHSIRSLFQPRSFCFVLHRFLYEDLCFYPKSSSLYSSWICLEVTCVFVLSGFLILS